MRTQKELEMQYHRLSARALVVISKRRNATALKSIPYDWQVERMVLRKQPFEHTSRTYDRNSPLRLSTVYGNPQKVNVPPMSELLHTSLDQPEHIVTWNIFQMMTHRVPFESTLEVLQRIPHTTNIAPILRDLPIDGFTLAQRALLATILLRRDLVPEATVQLDHIFRSEQISEIPHATITDLWSQIAQNFFTCPRMMFAWLENMPADWSMPAEVATKLIVSPVIAPISLAYKIISVYSKSAAAHSPSPYYAFFIVAKSTLRGKLLEAADIDDSALPQASILRSSPTRGSLHWRCVWQIFQCLNSKVPNWMDLLSHSQVEALSMAVLETMLVRAPPVMCLYTARRIVKAGIMSEVYCAVLLLKRLPENILSPALPVMRRLYAWLVQRYPVQSGWPFDVLVVANALIRVDLFDCVADLYDGIFQGIHSYSSEQKQKIVDTFVDIVCPECANILRSGDVHTQRTCMNCFATITKKGEEELPSFQPTKEIVQASKRRNREVFKDSIKALRARPDMGSAPPERVDPLARLRREVLEEPVLPAKVSLGSREIELSLPADQLEIKDVEALRTVASRKHEIESRSRALQGSSTDVSLLSLMTKRAELPSTTSLKPLLAGFDTAALFSTSPQGDARAADEPPRMADSMQKRAPGEPLFVKSTVKLWDCIWCGEENKPETRTCCAACGAETGPDSVWRTFLFCPGSGQTETKAKPTNLEELDFRLTDVGGKTREHVVAAAYWVMLYQKKFLLTADGAKIRLLNGLVLALCSYKERVMAAYVYFRLIPPAYRETESIPPLMRLFGQRASPKNVPPVAIARIIGKTTCTTCFDLEHTWRECPLIARRVLSRPGAAGRGDQSRLAKPIMSHTERIELEERVLKKSIEAIADFHAGKRAFTLFLELTEPLRFCKGNVGDANQLVQSLLAFGHRKRAAYVFNHIARHQRANASYELLGKWYGVSADEMAPQLRNRRLGDPDSPHPYFAQVIGVCCVCMEEAHAAHMCPIFAKWYTAELSAAQNGKIQYRFRGLTAGQSQAKSFCMSGPERLDAFYKYLLQVSSDFTGKIAGSAVQLGANSCVQMLLLANRHKAAKRLLMRIPQSLLDAETIKCYTDATGREMVPTDISTDDRIPIDAILDRDTCWLCYEKGHGLGACPTHAGKKVDDRIADTVEACLESGQQKLIAAAADFVLAHYIRGRYQLLFASRAFSARIEVLINRCVANGYAQRAAQLFSVLSLCTKKTTAAVFGSLKLSESTLGKLMPGTMRTVIIQAIESYGVCPHCMVPEDHSMRCPTLQDQHDFGRNILAIFRSEILLSGTREVDGREMNVMGRFKRLLVAHGDYLPYHIPQVRIAMNALACHYFLDKEMRDGMEVLQAIPMQYRKPLLYHRCLQAYGLSSPRVLHDIRARLSQRVDVDDIVFCEPLHEEIFLLKDQKTLCRSCWEMGHETDKCTAERPAVPVELVQMFDFEHLKREIDVIQTEMEAFYDVKLGTRHPLFNSDGKLQAPTP